MARHCWEWNKTVLEFKVKPDCSILDEQEDHQMNQAIISRH
jgi:hypothetical protein